MQEIPGKRDGTSRYVYDGYEYHIDTTSVTIFRCATRTTTGCRGKAEVHAGNRVEVYQPHEGHPRNETILEESQMRCEMLDRAKRTNAPFKEIFDDVCRRNPDVAPKFTFPQMRGAMQRARAKVRPAIPASLPELAEALAMYEPTERVYRGMVEATDGSVALLFSTDSLLRALGQCREIYVDGTFKVAPCHPPVAQLYTVHMRVKDCGIAAVYILCGARTRALYSAIFARLAELAPDLAENLSFIMGDYERAAMNALREVFPRASLHGCWFHFNQALVRRWRHLRLSNAPSAILSMAMALPLAPADRFDEGLGILAEMADRIAVDHPAVLQFMSYMRRQWSPLAEVVSVHGCPSRTNNLVESFHNEAKRKLGGLHPNIWTFLEHLTELAINQELDMDRLNAVGGRVRRGRTLRNMARDATIRDAQHDLSVGRYTLKDFLSRCGNRTAGYTDFERRNVQEEEAVEDAALVQPGLLAVGEARVNEPVPRGGRRRHGARGRARAGVADADADEENVDVVPPRNPENEPGRGRGGRGRGGRGRAMRAPPAVPRNRVADEGVPPPAEIVEPAVQPAAPIQRPAPDDRPAETLSDPNDSDLEIVEPFDFQNEERDIFHLPEDDLPYFPEPEEPLPFHPIRPLPAEEPIDDAGAAVRSAETCCCACLTEPVTHAYIPCGHKCCCSACAQRIPDRCPLCRTEALGVFLIR